MACPSLPNQEYAVPAATSLIKPSYPPLAWCSSSASQSVCVRVQVPEAYVERLNLVPDVVKGLLNVLKPVDTSSSSKHLTLRWPVVLLQSVCLCRCLRRMLSGWILCQILRRAY